MRIPSFREVKNLFKDDGAHKDGLRFKGHIKIEVFDEHGSLKQEFEKDNLIVNTGFQLIADALFKSASRPSTVGWIAVGTGTVAAAAGNTLLGEELARVAVSTNSYASKVQTLVASFPAGTGTGAITEAGCFNVATANTAIMLNRVVFPVINKGANDTMQITFTFTLS